MLADITDTSSPHKKETKSRIMKKRKSNKAAYAKIVKSARKKARLRHLTKERRKKHCAFCTLNLNHEKEDQKHNETESLQKI